MAPSKPSAATRQILSAMGENFEQIHARLGDLLSRVDSMTLEIGNLGKQLEMTQESVGEVRMKQR